MSLQPGTLVPLASEAHRAALELSRSISPRRDRFRPKSVLSDPEPGLRIRLLRAGAAWLIGWALILAILNWAVPTAVPSVLNGM